MNVFGKDQSLQIEVYTDPEKELTDSKCEEIHEVADSAFDKQGVPEKSDTLEHIIPSDSLVAAKLGDRYVGFSSSSEIEGTVYEVGIAVREEMQGNSLGRLMLTRSVEELCNGEETFTYRTQNPDMYGLSDNLFDVYPVQGETTPERLMENVEDVADVLAADELEGHVQKGAYRNDYDGAMYEELSDGERREFLEKRGMRPFEGDAVIVAGEVSEDEVRKKYEESLQEIENRHNMDVEEV